jgi:transporter family protein
MSYSWLIYALLSAIFAALVAIFAKIGLKNIDVNTATAIRAIIMAIFLSSVIFAQGKLSQINIVLANRKAFLYIVLGGIAGALSWLFYFIALKRGTVSQVVPIDRLSIVFAIIFAILLLGEKINLLKGAGIILMVIGAIVIIFGSK